MHPPLACRGAVSNRPPRLSFLKNQIKKGRERVVAFVFDFLNRDFGINEEHIEKCSKCGSRWGWIFIKEIGRIMPCLCECPELQIKQQKFMQKIGIEIRNRKFENLEVCPF